MVPSVILAEVTASVANLSVVTFKFLILAVSTASSASLAVVTLASLIFTVSTASVASMPTTTLPVPIAVTPAFVIVTSPDGVTSVATLDAFPK